MREPPSEAFAFLLLEAPDVLLGLGLVQHLDLLLGWHADHLEDLNEHVRLALRVELRVPGMPPVRRQWEARGAWEQRPSVHDVRALEHAQQLRINAAHRPHIDRLGVILLEQDQLRGAVPPRHNVPRELLLQPLRGRHMRDVPDIRTLILPRRGRMKVHGILLASDGPGKTEVADLDGAILVDETIGGLQIPVVDAGRVDVLQTCEQVVEQGVDVQSGQRHVGLAKLLQVGICKLLDDVNLVEGRQVGRRHDV
mmetsp:Transcript_2571/g.7642  ORF Transcript_2571/g.7642 Transcript_2571/m.7642 type:complete len:253 (-) Transcript_2571:301-1059(-)